MVYGEEEIRRAWDYFCLNEALKKCKVGEKLTLHFLIYNTQNCENYQTLTDTLNFEVVFFS